MNNENDVTKLLQRCKKIGIELELLGNYPWIYLDKVNGNKVKEKFESDWGFTIAYYPVKYGENAVRLLDIGKVFDIIKKYK
jgi:hypothetical protein